MLERNSAVFGIYSTHEALEAAVDALRAKGFRSTDISVLSTQKPRLPELTHENGPTAGASAGPGLISSVGGTLGWLVGISALAMAGGVFVVAGPIMAALASMGEAVGGIAGALTGFGVPEIQAKDYEGRVLSGGMLLSVHTDDQEWFRHGRHILEQTGAEGITAVEPAGTAPVSGMGAAVLADQIP
jgi:hypothetical protein